MNYTLSYNPIAFQDIDHILNFLAEIHPELPRKFRNLLAENLGELDKNPERWSPLSNEVRAIRMKLSKRLAYYCFYHYYEREKRILVLRVLPQNVDPKKWPSQVS